MDKATADMIAEGNLAAFMAGIPADERAEYDAPDGRAWLILAGVCVIKGDAGQLDAHSHGTAMEARECFQRLDAEATAYLANQQAVEGPIADLAVDLAQRVMAGELTLPEAVQTARDARAALTAARTASIPAPPTDRVGFYL
jgi:hypothetical protein